MIKLIEKIENEIVEILNSFDITEVKAKLVECNRPELGQYQYNGIMAVAGKNGFKPQDLAQKVCAKLIQCEEIDSCNVAGVGFINISFKPSALIEQVNNTQTEIEELGRAKNHKIFIDYGGPNVAKTLHVGHLRSADIGEGLKRLARKLGYEVIADVHFGDWGRQMGMVIVGIEERMPDLPFFDPNFDGEYPTVSPVTNKDLEIIYPEANIKAKEDLEFLEKCRKATYELQNGRKGYVALWKLFVAESIRPALETYKFLNVAFDLYEGESTCNDLIAPMVKNLIDKKVAYESQGAIVVDVAKEEDKIEVPPFIVLKSDGAAMYSTTDMATIVSRQERFTPNEYWYVADSRQSLHFEQLFRAVKKAEIVPADSVMTHFAFGTMNGQDGRPFKTRDGGVMTPQALVDIVSQAIKDKMKDNELLNDEICNIISSATLKFADLSNNRETDFIFDIDKFCALEGKTGPYVLYTTVRANSILKKANAENVDSYQLLPLDNNAYNDVLLNLIKAPEILKKAYEQKALNVICDYVFNLSNAFNNFYAQTKILIEQNEKVKQSYLKLCQMTAKMNEQMLDILAIKVPERM